MAMDTPTCSQTFAFVSWDGSLGRRVCPLATFGSRSPQMLKTRLACADPPRADQPELKNTSELNGAIALVVRGGCAFGHKARLLQRAGAVAMILANNTREEPLAAFTMGESPEDLEEKDKSHVETLKIPCVMMCLKDVRELFKKYPPSVKNGSLVLEILPQKEAEMVADECLRLQRQQYEAERSGRGWKAIKSTTSSIIKLLESQTSNPVAEAEPQDADPQEEHVRVAPAETQPPPLAFVQWATSASSYEVCFAPLADFCLAAVGTSFSGRLVQCDPILADESLRNAQELRGAIALLQRGSCSFPEKIARAQRAGAVAVIVGNDDEKDPDAAFVMSVDRIDAANATLPAVMVSRRVFARLRENTKETTARILCLLGESAEGLLASSGARVSFAKLAMPAPSYSSDTKENDSDDLLFDLHVACRRGEHAGCQRILAQLEGQDGKRELVCKACPLNGLTALHHACAGGNDNVVELLLQFGAEPDVMDWAMQTPLHVACAHNNADCARLLLRAECSSAVQVPAALYNVEEKYGGISTKRHIGGRTAMHEAAQSGSAECIELLLSANARLDSTAEDSEVTNKYVFLGVSCRDLEGCSPLHLACNFVHAECALYLIAANADIDRKDCNGHSPMLLACEAANDSAKEAAAAQIIGKLISSGAVMKEEDQEEDDADYQETGGKLLLDRVKSAELRRELEVLYLRHEARVARRSSWRLEHESATAQEQLQELRSEIARLRIQVAEQDVQGQELQELRTQVQTILQFLTTQNINGDVTAPVLAAATESVVTTPLSGMGLSHTTDKSEEELALDAALARDLGKKCLRQGQQGLAEKYFQTSLELFPLPRVNHLLDKAKSLRLESEQNDGPLLDPKFAQLPSTSATSGKNVAIQRLRDQLEKADSNTPACTMLEREISKLEGFSENDSEFSSAFRWVEWLMALPWGDPSSGLQSEKFYDSKRNLFDRLNELELEKLDSHRKKAACTIQRTFRGRYAAHLALRADSAARIQAVVRGRLARQHYNSPKQTTREDHVQLPSRMVYEHDGTDVAGALDLDYTSAIDPTLYRQLKADCRQMRLIAGQQVLEQSFFRVVQLVTCDYDSSGLGKSTLYFAGSDAALTGSVFFVWSRWGKRRDEKCQSSLGGPYEGEIDAQRRFDRIIGETQRRNGRKNDNSSHQNAGWQRSARGIASA